MTALPIRPPYGPTLGTLLAPRWRAAPRLVRRTAITLGAAIIVLAVAAVLTFASASYSHGGRVRFSFNYRGLYRAEPEPGGYVRVTQRRADGELRYAFAVGPLTLPPYAGELSAELPLYASRYIDVLRHRDPGFVLRGEGKTKVNTMFAYDVLYTALVEGRRMYGRDVLLVPERPGAREGVEIGMLTAPGASRQIRGPSEVATVGVLQKPLRSFAFG